MRDSQLSPPTLIVNSGGGVHVYWRIDEPILDLGLWTDIQKALAGIFKSDGNVHDPPRVRRCESRTKIVANPRSIMRLPAFRNHKYTPSKALTKRIPVEHILLTIYGAEVR